jgi:hypothetical protein
VRKVAPKFTWRGKFAMSFLVKAQVKELILFMCGCLSVNSTDALKWKI